MKSLDDHLQFNCLCNYISPHTHDGTYMTINGNIVKLYRYDTLLEESELLPFIENPYRVSNRDHKISFINDSSLIGEFLQTKEVADEIGKIFFNNYKVNTYEEYQYLNGWEYIDDYNAAVYSIKNNIIKISNITEENPLYFTTKKTELSDDVFKLDFVIERDGNYNFHLSYDYYGSDIEEIFFNIIHYYKIRNSLLEYYDRNKKISNREKIISDFSN